MFCLHSELEHELPASFNLLTHLGIYVLSAKLTVRMSFHQTGSKSIVSESIQFTYGKYIQMNSSELKCIHNSNYLAGHLRC